jgi:hypothetical protein
MGSSSLVDTFATRLSAQPHSESVCSEPADFPSGWLQPCVADCVSRSTTPLGRHRATHQRGRDGPKCAICYMSTLFTQPRRSGILRSSPLTNSRKLGLPWPSPSMPRCRQVSTGAKHHHDSGQHWPRGSGHNIRSKKTGQVLFGNQPVQRVGKQRSAIYRHCHDYGHSAQTN